MGYITYKDGLHTLLNRLFLEMENSRDNSAILVDAVVIKRTPEMTEEEICEMSNARKEVIDFVKRSFGSLLKLGIINGWNHVDVGFADTGEMILHVNYQGSQDRPCSQCRFGAFSHIDSHGNPIAKHLGCDYACNYRVRECK